MLQARHDADSYRRVEVITGGRRRRSWSEEEKARIVAESADPDANISEVARRNGVNRGLLTVWRRQARVGCPAEPAFAQVQIEEARSLTAAAGVDAATRIEIEFADARVHVPQGVGAATLRNIFAALRSTR